MLLHYFSWHSINIQKSSRCINNYINFLRFSFGVSSAVNHHGQKCQKLLHGPLYRADILILSHTPLHIHIHHNFHTFSRLEKQVNKSSVPYVYINTALYCHFVFSFHDFLLLHSKQCWVNLWTQNLGVFILGDYLGPGYNILGHLDHTQGNHNTRGAQLPQLPNFMVHIPVTRDPSRGQHPSRWIRKPHNWQQDHYCIEARIHSK